MLKKIEVSAQPNVDFAVSTFSISCITSAAGEMVIWQNRPPDDVYLIVWMDGIVFKERENSDVINKTICLAVGLNREGRKEVMEMWLEKNESSSFWIVS